jgi:hypothetical protein
MFLENISVYILKDDGVVFFHAMHRYNISKMVSMMI